MSTRSAKLNVTRIVRSCAAFLLAITWATTAFCGPIHDATRKGDEAKVIALLKQNPDLVSSRDKFGNTPLHIAAMHDQPAIAALLLANGADVNARNSPDPRELIGASYTHQKAYGETPLSLALLSYQHKEMVELLLTHGADPNMFVHIQVTPLHLAVERNLLYDVELLLANGADPDVINRAGLTSVHWAIMHDQTRILELLLDNGANPNARDGAGHTPMFYAENNYRSFYGETRANEKAIAILRAHGGHK